MFYKPDIREGRPFEDPNKLLMGEEFFDSTDRKVYINRARREFTKSKILFQINLEERRHRLTFLLDSETKQLIDENLNKIQGIEARKNNLLQKAIQIRRQKEIESQEVSENKIKLLNQLSNDSYRTILTKNHQMHIKEDVENIKNIKERLRREEKCTKEFWKSKIGEKVEDLLSKEKIIQLKKDNYKKECLEQIDIREKDRQLERDAVKEDRARTIKSFDNLQREIMEEKSKAYEDSLQKKKLYRETLDNHIQIAKKFKDTAIANEKSFNAVMLDENVQQLRHIRQTNILKKQDNMKMLKDFLHYSDCLKKGIKEEDSVINETVKRIHEEVHHKRRAVEIQKAKKYHDLIVGIKDHQKYQMLEANKKKAKEKSAELIEKEIYNRICIQGIAKDKEQIKQYKIKVMDHGHDLKAQLVYNEQLNVARQLEHDREIKAMQDSESSYINTRNDIVANVKLMNMHPWRGRPIPMK